MFYAFLNSSTPETQPADVVPSWINIVLIVVLIVVFAVVLFFNSKKNKQKQQEYADQLAAIGPGNKVKTIGGLCGIVVEVCNDDNTVIIETGSATDASKKSYVKMDKEAIAQTDAKTPAQLAKAEAEAAKKAEEAPAVEETEEKAE